MALSTLKTRLITRKLRKQREQNRIKMAKETHQRMASPSTMALENDFFSHFIYSQLKRTFC